MSQVECVVAQPRVTQLLRFFWLAVVTFGGRVNERAHDVTAGWHLVNVPCRFKAVAVSR